MSRCFLRMSERYSRLDKLRTRIQVVFLKESTLFLNLRLLVNVNLTY